MSKLPSQRDETLGGYIVHGIPFPVSTDEEALEFLKKMAPIQIEQEYKIRYLHSYGQDSPWFAALTNKRLLASRDPESGYTTANPRGHEMDRHYRAESEGTCLHRLLFWLGGVPARMSVRAGVDRVRGREHFVAD